MPNWCYNSLEVQGSPEDLTRFKETVSNDEQQFDFNRIVSMPEDLNISARGRPEMAYEAFYGDPTQILTYEWVKEKNIETVEQLREHFDTDPEVRKQADRYKANFDKYGYTYWYDWRLDQWGTKWNVDDPVVSDEGNALTITFDTAWSPPLPIFEKLAAMFPT